MRSTRCGSWSPFASSVWLLADSISGKFEGSARLLPCSIRSRRPVRHAGIFGGGAARVCLSRRPRGWRYPGEQHLPGGVHPSEPRHTDQRHPSRLANGCKSGCYSSARRASIPKTVLSPSRKNICSPAPLEPTNRPYALAKIAGIEMCWPYNRQYGTRFLAAMPTNLYGPGGNYDLQTSHVLPALIRKFHEATVSSSPQRDASRLPPLRQSCFGALDNRVGSFSTATTLPTGASI